MGMDHCVDMMDVVIDYHQSDLDSSSVDQSNLSIKRGSIITRSPFHSLGAEYMCKLHIVVPVMIIFLSIP